MSQHNSAQLPLAFGQVEAYSFADFLSGNNAEAVHRLQSLANMTSSTGGLSLFLWGPVAAGKSHLLQALCRSLSAVDRPSAYLPLNKKEKYPPQILDGIENLSVVCLDDVENIEGDSEWEQALFNLYNRIRDMEHVLIMTAVTAPASISFKLPDLASRLNGSLIYQLHELEDEEKLTVLKNKVALRGFDMPDEVAEYLLKRLPRDMHALSYVVEMLDKATLAAKRKLSIPFVRDLLERNKLT